MYVCGSGWVVCVYVCGWVRVWEWMGGVCMCVGGYVCGSGWVVCVYVCVCVCHLWKSVQLLAVRTPKTGM